MSNERGAVDLTPAEEQAGDGVELEVVLLTGMEVTPGRLGDYDVVLCVLELKTLDGEDRSCVLALPREDAIKVVERIKSVAATVSPIEKQAARAAREEGTNG